MKIKKDNFDHLINKMNKSTRFAKYVRGTEFWRLDRNRRRHRRVVGCFRGRLLAFQVRVRGWYGAKRPFDSAPHFGRNPLVSEGFNVKVNFHVLRLS